MTALTNRYVTLQLESTYGAEPVASTAGQFLGEVDDESFSQNFDLLTRTDISRYGASKSIQGLTYSEGDVNLPLQLDDFNSFCLFAAFGVDTFDNSATPKTHTLTETTDDTLFPSFCIRVGREDAEHTYCGMVLDSLSLSANINEYVMMTYSFVGCGEIATAALQTPGGGGTNPPNFSTVDALHFAKAFVRFEGVASDSDFSTLVKSISLDLSMNRDTDNASSLGKSTYAVEPPATLREITGSIEFNVSNDVVGGGAGPDNAPTYDELRGFLLHDGTNVAPALMIRLEDGSTPANFFEMKFPKVVYEAPELNVSGRDTSTLSVSFVVLFEDVAAAADSYMAKAVIGMAGINGNAAMTD
tara:strand:- start:45 stop:1118 length:1074 start_codon:yes stop_codon:yes gene_type:complete